MFSYLGKGLPDPPNMRENLVRQIQMFVKLLQEKTSKENRFLFPIFIYKNNRMGMISDSYAASIFVIFQS